MKEVMVFIAGKPPKIAHVPDDYSTLVIKHGDGSQKKLNILTIPFSTGVKEEIFVYAADTDITYEELKKAELMLGH